MNLNDHNLLLKARWHNPRKYRRKVVIEDHGYSYHTIKWDRSLEEILEEVRKDYKLDNNNQPIVKKSWWKFW